MPLNALINTLAALKKNLDNSISAQLAFIAGLSGLIYALFFTLRFPLTRLYNTIPPVDYAKLTHHSAGGLAAYIIGIGLLFWLYWRAIRLAAPDGGQRLEIGKQGFGDRDDGGTQRAFHRRPAVGGRFLLLNSSVLAVISVFCYPLTAIDLFVYAIWTRGWAVYGLVPTLTTPKSLPTGDPWLGLAGEWIDAASPYGPVWELLSWAAFHLSGGGFLAHLLALKILAALAYVGCVWLVYQTLQYLRPEWAVAGAIAFAWNPLVLLESVQNGHNDIVMMFFLLAAIWTLVRWRNYHHPYLVALLICLLLALSILVKFITVLIVPFILAGMVVKNRTSWRQWGLVLVYGVFIAGIVVAAMTPFWPGWNNWAVVQANSGAGRSLLALLILSLRKVINTNAAFDLARHIIYLTFGLIYLFYLWRTLVERGLLTLLKGRNSSATNSNNNFSSSPLRFASAFSVLFWYVLLAAPVFHAWYLLWFSPLAALLLPYRRPLRATIAFSITALLVIPYFETIRVWYPFLLDNQLIGHLVGVPSLIVPPIIALLWPIRSSDHSEVLLGRKQ